MNPKQTAVIVAVLAGSLVAGGACGWFLGSQHQRIADMSAMQSEVNTDRKQLDADSAALSKQNDVVLKQNSDIQQQANELLRWRAINPKFQTPEAFRAALEQDLAAHQTAGQQQFVRENTTIQELNRCELQQKQIAAARQVEQQQGTQAALSILLNLLK